MTKHIEIIDAREYCEGIQVNLVTVDGVYASGLPQAEWQGHGRLAIQAYNESGYNSTQVDLLDLIKWLRNNYPELLNQ